MGDESFYDYVVRKPYAAYVLLALIVVFLFNQVDRFLLGVARLPSSIVDYKSSDYGLLAGPVFTVAFTVAGVFLGKYADAVNRVHALVAALVVWSIGTAITAAATQFWHVAVARLLLGVGQSLCNPLAASIIGSYFKAEHRGTAMGIYYIGIYIGYDIALGAGTKLSEALGWQGVYILFGALGLLVAIAFILTVNNDATAAMEGCEKTGRRLLGSFSDTGLVDTEINETEAAAPVVEASSWYDIMIHWIGSPSLILICVAAGVRNAGGYVWGNYTPLFFSPLFTFQKVSTGVAGIGGSTYVTCTSSFVAGMQNSTSMCDKSFPYCVKEGMKCAKLSQTPWHDQGMSLENFETFMSWVPLVAGSMGAIFGGYISDRYVKTSGPLGRVGIIFTSILVSAPFAFGALVLPYPWCFVSLIPANLFGEMWIGATLALVTDLSPASMRTVCISIFFFINTNIGGNMPALVPVLEKAFAGAVPYDETLHTFNLDLAEGTTAVEQESSSFLKSALFFLYPGVYVGGGVLFVLALLTLRTDIENARKLEEQEVDDDEGEETRLAVKRV